MAQIQRLEGRLPDEFSQPLVAGREPVRFLLDGRTIRGWKGDSVLSAVLASGIDTVGLHEGYPVGLSERFAPPVTHRDNQGRADLAVPMALCPAVEGMDLVTLGPRRSRNGLRARLGATLGRRGNSLDIDLDAPALDISPWIDSAIGRVEAVDCVVIGGGLSGMSAARAAAEAGLSTILIEDKQVPGGYARYFGRAEGEPDPAAATAELSDALARNANAQVRLSTLATRMAPGWVETVGMALEDTVPYPERIRIEGRMVVLASGTGEILPLFPGNRLPGVTLASAAWSLAHRFGLWPGATALVNGSTNVTYRLALLAADSDVKLTQACDPRIAPQSRFIEFCKAYGFKLRWGTAIERVLGASGKLGVYHRDLQSGRIESSPEMVDTAIVSGGFAPDLSLWVAAGGGIEVGADGMFTLADPALPGVAVTGFAAGYQSHSGAIASGRAAIARLLGAPIDPIHDVVFDAHFETPQALYPAPAAARTDEAPAYFGSGRSLSAMLRAPERKGWRDALSRRREAVQAQLDREPFALALDDCIGKFTAGGLTPGQLERLVLERCIPPTRMTIGASAPETTPWDPRAIPDLLARRFGPTQHIWQIATDDNRRLSRGALIFLNSDRTSPSHALGVILGEVAGLGTVGLFGASRRAGEALVARDGRSSVPIRLIERAEPPQDA